jgi:Alternative complex III, ActD subunit
MNGTPKPYGVIAEFTNAAGIMHAAEKVRDAGFKRWDVFTPFPVHGMDRAMGLKNSKVGWFAFLGGCTGYACGMLMIWFMNAVNYAIVVGGKPMFSPYSAFPPSYELTILFGAFGSLGGMLFLNRLPRLHHPLLKNRRFARVTHDRFFLVIETGDPKYSEPGTIQMLERAGSNHIEVVEE